MEFLIKEQIQPKYKNCYVLQITWMFGDADHFENTEVKFDKKECIRLSEYVLLLKKMLVYWPCGRAGGTYFKKEFLPELRDYDGLFESPYIEYYNDGDPDGYEIFYYDENGNQYEVEVEFTTEELEIISNFEELRKKHEDITLDRINDWKEDEVQ